MVNNSVPSLTLPGSKEKLGESLKELRTYIGEVSDLANIGEDAMNRLRLAVDEIASNIILYAYAETDGEIQVTSTIDKEHLTVTLADTGPAFDPLLKEMPASLGQDIDDKDVGGLGVYLALINVDDFHYKREENKNLNIFKMNRPPQSDVGPDSKQLNILPAENKGHILVAEANKTTRNTLVQHLENKGHTVQCVKDGREAHNKLMTEPFDLVLLGIDLPNMDGYEVLKAIREEPKTKLMSVIMISRTAEVDCIVRSLQFGADDYIQEPFLPLLLDARIKVGLDRKNFQASQQRQLDRFRMLANHMENRILPLGIALSSGRDWDRLLERILDEAQSICNADSSALTLCVDNVLHFKYIRNNTLGWKMGGVNGDPVTLDPIPLYDPETGEPNNQGAAVYVATTGKVVNIADIYKTSQFNFSIVKESDRLNNYRTVSALAVPLKDCNNQIIAVIMLFNAQNEEGKIIPFDDYHQLVVESLASQAAIVRYNQLLMQRTEMLIDIEKDVQIARNIQQNFLPNKMPEVPGMEIAALFKPARKVAGDFYDVFMMSGNLNVGLIIADICDKGVGAALFMSLTRSLLRAFSTAILNAPVGSSAAGARNVKTSETQKLRNIRASDVRTAIFSTNEYITEHHGDLSMFATTFYGMLSPLNGQIWYINAGHCPPWVIGQDGKIKNKLESTGPAVGMFAGADFVVKEIKLERGDILLAITDGITDARDTNGQLFGEEGIEALLLPPVKSAQELIDRIDTSLQKHTADTTQYDDITLLVARRA